eukprot:7617954-Pyramimonas_sp.AAC.1
MVKHDGYQDFMDTERKYWESCAYVGRLQAFYSISIPATHVNTVLVSYGPENPMFRHNFIDSCQREQSDQRS